MSTLIAERFEILSELTESTYRARDSETGADVALSKQALSTRWSSGDDFEHDVAKFLALEHPGLPRYRVAFCEDGHGYLAQDFVDGPTLAQLLDEGKEWTAAEALRDATAVLEALNHLHRQDPPIGHGRIGLDRLIRSPDGSLVLVGLRPDDHTGDRDAREHDLRDFGRAMERMLGDDLSVAPALARVLRRLSGSDPVGGYECASDVLDDLRLSPGKTAPLEPPSEETQPAEARPLGAPDDTSTAPLVAPKPVAKNLDATAPLAAPKPVPTSRLNATAPLAAPKPVPKPSPEPLKIPGPSEEDEPGLYHRRTKNFPKWCTVEPVAHGEFLIEFEMRDVDERRLEISIVDKFELLELRTYVNRMKREAARKKRVVGVLVAGVTLAVILYTAYAPLLPLAIMATIGGVAALMFKNDQATEAPAVELVIAPAELTLVRDDEFKLRASPRSARWSLERNTDLVMVMDRQVPVLELSREARIQADWFHRYLQARCEEIASRARFDANASSVEDETTQQVPLMARGTSAPDELETAEQPLRRRDDYP